IVRCQKDVEHDGIEPWHGPQAEVHQAAAIKKIILQESFIDEDGDMIETKLDDGLKTSALLEGQ
ncbi:hypothetical protein Tco_1552244, partial [Tanacetum coccineum]